MKVTVIKSFKWAPDGNNVEVVEAGRVAQGELAELALKMGCGKAVLDQPPVRLPLLAEYVAAGYHAENYERMIANETEAAQKVGRTVEIRDPTTEEGGTPWLTPPPPPKPDDVEAAAATAAAPPEAPPSLAEAPAPALGKKAKSKGR